MMTGSRSETDAVRVTIDIAGLSDGAHTGTVTVGSNDGTKSGTISMTVRESPPPPPPTGADVAALTPIGMLAMVGLLGIVGIGAIRRR